jgi:hypothetical protein
VKVKETERERIQNGEKHDGYVIIIHTPYQKPGDKKR